MRKGSVRQNEYRIEGDTAFLKLIGDGAIHECAIDLADLPSVLTRRWHAEKMHKENGTYYAISGTGSANMKVLSRFILRVYDDRLVDHIDGNGLNNRRRNMRAVVRQVNCFHRVRLNIDSSTGYRNVHHIRSEGTYRVQIRHNKKSYYVGRFNTPEAANVAAIAMRNRLNCEVK
jgi:hypothetical protein